MTIAVLANEEQKKEWIEKGVADEVEVLWCGSVRTLLATSADVYIDLTFINDRERMAQYKMREGFPFFVNAVEETASSIGNGIIRINAWPGMLKREFLEVAIAETDQAIVVEEVMKLLGWKYIIVPDIPGMITARVICSIINEAYYTFGDGISSKEEIDIAMKLGTNYPFGPFEWAELIGIDKVVSLLTRLGVESARYDVAPSLLEEYKKNS
jgi:3-hydroxybutyryl-CoA dehydrogenase